MEAPLGYMDEKEVGVQKPKKPPEIQVENMPVSGPLWVWGGGWVQGPSQVLPLAAVSQASLLAPSLSPQDWSIVESKHWEPESGF